MMRNLLLVTSGLMLSSACSEIPGDALDDVVEMRNVQENDTVLQGPGVVLQGPGVVLQGPGVVLQGPGVVLQGPGVVLQGPGVVLQGMKLVGTSFSATATMNGVVYQVNGLDFIGAEMDLDLKAVVHGVETTQKVSLRINNIQQSAEQDDILVYDIQYRAIGSEQWLPYCGNSQIGAVPFVNSWDTGTGDRIDDATMVTFGCTNAVLAKCALWGYRPWATETKCTGKGKKTKCVEVSLRDHHQACTRMARADFCGDGTPHTVDGTSIDVFDNLSTQTRVTDWPVEAEWTPEGASCVNFVRHPELGYPECFLKKGKPMKFNDCDGKLKGEGELIASAFSADGDDEDEDGDGKCSD